MLTQPAVATTAARAQPWVHGRLADIALGWCWLPIALIVHRLESSVSNTQAAMALIFVLSFAHQPLTLGLVYADPVQRRAHRRFYAWTPLVMLVLIVVGLNVSLALVGLMAGLWNAEHTLMQRYGVMRIYGRKAGDDHGRIEKPMLIVWLVTALLFLGAYVDLPRMAARLGVDQTNTSSVDALHSISHVAAPLFWIGALASIVLAVRWGRAELATAHGPAQMAKWIYTAATLGLVVAVVVDPIAGIAGYVAAHAIEYFGVVHGSLRRRATAGAQSPLALAVRTRGRRTALYVAYFVATVVLVVTTIDVWNGQLYAFLVLFFGALHILYDGLVWKLRTPAVAASLGIAASSTG